MGTLELLAEYRCLLSTNMLVSAVNNDGHPTSDHIKLAPNPDPLVSESESVVVAQSGSSAASDPSYLPLRRFMNSVSILSVRNWEVNTMLACKSPPANEPDQPKYYPIFSGNPGNDIYRRSESDLADPAHSSNDWTSFVLLSNPDVHDQYFDGPGVTGAQECIMVGSGESHMPKILDQSGHWEKCLSIS
jgi:hypothetical protein